MANDEMLLTCPICGEQMDAYDARLENDRFDDKQWYCITCHENRLDSGAITQCEHCDECFSPKHLEMNPKNGDYEICPYCKEVWCP